MNQDFEKSRYSDAELEEFRILLETKLNKATAQFEALMDQITETAENSGSANSNDWIDSGSFNSEMDMLNLMAARQSKYIQELKAALGRVRNKTFGICSITGKLIDKKRLLAVPTTTK